MKVYRVELLIIDHDEIGDQEICDVLENESYPNHCMTPKVMSMAMREVEWTDDHPLNIEGAMNAEFNRLFSQ